MVRAGDAIENPVTGQRLTFLETGAYSGGESFRAEGAFPPAGFAGVEQTIAVPAGTRHTFGNAGDDEMRVVFQFRPAPESTQRSYELYFGFAQEGHVNSKALPDLLDIALIWPLVSHHAVLARPPVWVQ